MVANACNPRTLGGQGGQITRSGDRDHPDQHSETLSLLKTQEISQVWWCIPIISTTWEAEVGELLSWLIATTASQDHATSFQPGQQ